LIIFVLNHGEVQDLETLFMTNERALIEACIRQDRVAQRKLYEQYAGKLHVVAMRYVKNREDAQDVLQDSFIKIFKYLDSFRFDCPFEAWMRRVVANTALKHLRDRPDLSNHVDAELASDEVEAADLTISGFQFEQLLEMIQKLPEGCRTIFNLYAIEGYQHNEIAKMLEISEGTSKSQYSRAKSLLQVMIHRELKLTNGAIREI
jgi:RNA polymerase sigma factor (sigma-70 family)